MNALDGQVDELRRAEDERRGAAREAAKIAARSASVLVAVIAIAGIVANVAVSLYLHSADHPARSNRGSVGGRPIPYILRIASPSR